MSPSGCATGRAPSGTDARPRSSRASGSAALAHRYPGELSGGQRQRVALGRALAIDPALLLLDEPLSALDLPLRRALRDELRAVLTQWGKAAVVVTHDLTEAYRLGDHIVVYEEGRVIQSAPRAELLWQPASQAVARIMGLANVVQGTVLKATPDRIQLRWRGQILEAVNSPLHSYLPPPDSPMAFFIRPEYVRLIRKDRGLADPMHHMNVMRGHIVREADFGTTWTLCIRLDEPGEPAQGDFDLEVEVPHLVYEILEIERDRQWDFSIHRGSIHVLAVGMSDGATPVIALAGVRVVHGARAVLDVPALAVQAGETLGVMGPNGAGKSTLLRVLGLLEPPATGTVRFRGEVVTPAQGLPCAGAWRACSRSRCSPTPRCSTTRPWAFGSGASRARRLVRACRPGWSASASRALADRQARTLSGGEAQRVALARALVVEPELLLLDEPFAALDQPTRESLIQDLRGVLRADRVTTVLVTHHRGEALALGDRLAVLIGGCILQVGPAAQVFQAPDSEEVARFVGLETILAGRVRERRGRPDPGGRGGSCVRGGSGRRAGRARPARAPPRGRAARARGRRSGRGQLPGGPGRPRRARSAACPRRG